MNEVKCPDCGEYQGSLADKHYAVLFGTGWCCDVKRWREGKLSLDEFESRENAASEAAVSEMRR